MSPRPFPPHATSSRLGALRTLSFLLSVIFFQIPLPSISPFEKTSPSTATQARTSDSPKWNEKNVCFPLFPRCWSIFFYRHRIYQRCRSQVHVRSSWQEVHQPIRESSLRSMLSGTIVNSFLRNSHWWSIPLALLRNCSSKGMPSSSCSTSMSQSCKSLCS